MTSNDDLKNILRSIYFIQEEVEKDSPKSGTKKADETQPITNNLLYTSNMAKAYGIALDLDQDQMKALVSVQKTHSKFFTVTGMFDLASKNYHLCNTMENMEVFKAADRSRQTTGAINQLNLAPAHANSAINSDNYFEHIQVVNVTLSCIKKNHLNGFLAYNTLYFWLEHTMIVSVPICILVVIFLAMTITLIKLSHLLVQQMRVRCKRISLNQCLAEINYLNNQSMQRSLRSTKLRKKLRCNSNEGTPRSPNSRAKTVQIQEDTLHDYDEEEAFDNVNVFSQRETSQQIEIESQINRGQREYKQLNVMFLIDVFLYVLLSFPYTCMRLVLDLFVKDRIKINLDFFILYKLTLVAFHLHLIVKFFLLIIFNVKFRISLANMFACKPSYCCINDYSEDSEQESASHTCCMSTKIEQDEQEHGQFFNANIHTKLGSNFDENLYEIYHSTDSNTNLARPERSGIGTQIILENYQLNEGTLTNV